MLAGNEELDSYAENGPMINFPDLLSNSPMKELYLCDIDDIIRKISRTAKIWHNKKKLSRTADFLLQHRYLSRTAKCMRRCVLIAAHVKRWRK